MEFARHKLAKNGAAEAGDGHLVVIVPGLGERCARALAKCVASRLRLRTPPPVPAMSICSRTDGVVAWQTCRHARRSQLVHEIEVEGRHIGMGWSRAVVDAVRARLGQGPGRRKRDIHAA